MQVVWSLIFFGKGPTNTADTGVMEEVYEMIRTGKATDVCDALDKLMQAASCSARRQKIKATQKYYGCKRSHYSGNR
jgi:hypothetical protein